MDRYFKKQQGLSLIELLISLVLGSVITIAATQVVLYSFSSKRLLSAEAELQENARFGLSIINLIVQKAGGFGCRVSTATNTTSLLNTNDATFTPSLAIAGWEAENSDYGSTYTTNLNAPVIDTNDDHWTTSIGATLDDGISSIANSDILKVWYTKGVSSALTDTTDNVLSFSTLDVKQGDVLAINDCKTVTFAQVCSRKDEQADVSAASCNTPGNIDHDFSNLNLSTAEVNKLRQAIFFVSKPNNIASGVPTLYVAELGQDGKSGTPEELLTHVENLQVLYGEDTTGNNSPNYYVSGDAVKNWANVVSTKVSLLLRSKENNVLPNTQTINFNGAPVVIAKGDRYLRRVYTSTISLRNRTVGY